MLNLIYAFGIGMAFACGIGTGALLCSVATRKGREEFRKDIASHNHMVEERLLKYVAHTDRIANALEMIVYLNDGKRPNA